MTDYINQLLQLGLGNIIDMNVDEEILKDKMYCDAIKTAELLQQKLNTTTLSSEQKQMLEEYGSNMLFADERACYIAYLTGLRDTLLFLSSMKIIGGLSEKD